MTTGEFKRLWDLGATEHIQEGGSIDNTERVGAICLGAVRIARADQQQITLSEGHLLGEVAYVAQRAIKVPSMAAASLKSEIRWWAAGQLQALRETDPPLYAAFMLHVARDMAVKLTQPLEPGQAYYRFDQNKLAA